MCCAHLLHELTGVFDNHPEQTMARELYSKLLSMYRTADYYNQHPENQFVVSSIETERGCFYTRTLFRQGLTGFPV